MSMRKKLFWALAGLWLITLFAVVVSPKGAAVEGDSAKQDSTSEPMPYPPWCCW